MASLPRLYRQRLELQLALVLLSYCAHQEKNDDSGAGEECRSAAEPD